MIDQRRINRLIICGLERYCGCQVIFSNTCGHAPKYPYITCNIITPIGNNSGSYCVDGDQQYKEIKQIWSITAQTKDDMQALDFAYKAYDYLQAIGCMDLAEAGVIVSGLSDISARDNMITIAYEYRKGFDVTLNLLDRVTIPVNETIESYQLEQELKE